VSGTNVGDREVLDSGGVPAEHEAAAARLGWASTGRVSGLGSGQSWAGLSGQVGWSEVAERAKERSRGWFARLRRMG
jgi:osmotically-inducible protein OsmY